jgi:peptidoglycan/LPS O-acetylase OafA/YrhL
MTRITGRRMGNFVQEINNSAVRDGTYLPTLDGWRAIAILLVILAHGSDSIANALRSIGGGQLDLSHLRHIGLFGVQIFFGLSGLLITSRLIADENKHGRISLRSFYIRRAFRILPASLVFLATVGVLALAGILPVSPGRWLSTLLFFANYSTAAGTWYLGHFWSLAVEEHLPLLNSEWVTRSRTDRSLRVYVHAKQTV